MSVNETFRRRLLQVLSIIGLIGAWYAVSFAGVWSFDKAPLPHDVIFDLFAAISGEPMTNGGSSIYVHIGYTTYRALLGFAVATFIGVPLGLMIGWNRQVRDWTFPAVEVLRPIPPVAWIPVSVIAFAGAGEVGIIFITFIGAFFPIVLNTINGVEQIDPIYFRAIRNLGAQGRQVFREVVLPGSMPGIFTGLSVGMGLAWISVIAAEMIAGQFGVGYVTFQAYRLLDHELIIIGMLVLGGLGALSSALLRRSGFSAMPWRVTETE